MADTFEKFTMRARKVLELSHDEARRFNHNYIGTEHLLLGILVEGENVAARTLDKMGVQLSKVRSSVEFIIGRGEARAAGEIGLTPRAKNVIELAVDEARRMNNHYIGTEHLLLGLVREGKGVAAGVLESLGVDLEKVRAQVNQVARQEDPELRHRAGETFEKFTERARKVLALSQEEALRFKHPYIGTEHLLLGILAERENIAARILVSMGIELTKVRSAVEFIINRGETDVIGEIGMTPRAKNVVELAVDEARRLNHHYIGPEHLLLGLVREGEGIAAGVLTSLGVRLEDIRLQVDKLVDNRGDDE